MLAVEGAHALERPVVVETRLGLREAARSLGALDRHAEGQHVPVAQEIALLELRARGAALLGRVLQGALHDQDRLGRAEAPEGREGRQVRAAGVARDARVGHVVAARGVEQAALEDGRREVGRRAGVLVVGDLVGEQRARGVEPEPVVARVGMALARDQHVVAAVQGELDRTREPPGGERAHHGPGRGLVLLAAEGAAQAQHVDLDRAHREPQDARGDALHGGRSLGAGVDAQATALQGFGHGGLGLEVEVLLTGGVDAALDHGRAARPGPVDVAQLEGARGHDQGARRLGPARIEAGGQLLELGRDARRGGARLARALGHHEGDRLAHVVHLIRREERLVLDDGPDLVVAGDVDGREHSAHSAGAARGLGVEGEQPSVGDGRVEQRPVQEPRRFGQVVDVARLPAHVQAIVGPHRQSSSKPPWGNSPASSASTKWARTSWPSKRRL